MKIGGVLFFWISILIFGYAQTSSSRWLVEGGAHASIFSFRPKPDKVSGFLYQRIDTIVWGVGANLSYLLWQNEQSASISVQSTPRLGFPTRISSNLKSVALPVFAQMRLGGGSVVRSPHALGVGAGLGVGFWYYSVDPKEAYNYGCLPMFNIELTINIDEFPVILRFEQSLHGAASPSKYYSFSISGRWVNVFKR